ncbi:MAG TPA: mechanosensitive ion channel protein, partial [Lachnospiraceae bacterium]|nr:mechanosensitive ion channel protein [Lachnospiraceae bacterium]
LAIQGSLSNFVGGVLILLLKPFKVGDYIKEDANGNEGTVVSIELFYTKLTTPDNKVIVLPNGTLANSSLTNVTACDSRRLDIMVGISYDADIRHAK